MFAAACVMALTYLVWSMQATMAARLVASIPDFTLPHLSRSNGPLTVPKVGAVAGAETSVVQSSAERFFARAASSALEPMHSSMGAPLNAATLAFADVGSAP